MKHEFKLVLDERFVEFSPRVCQNCGLYLDPNTERGKVSFVQIVLRAYPDGDSFVIEKVMDS